jgi:hypothetical protein
MRIKAISQDISKEGISLKMVLDQLSELRGRIEQLEIEFFGYPSLPRNFIPPQRKPRKGRKPKLETNELLERWKCLTTWLEQNWPLLLIPMRKAEGSGNAPDAIAAIMAAKKHGISGVRQPNFYHEPEEFETDLAAFLKSGRYHGNPRNLAAAMAGLPELGWKRSFDICAAHPHKTGVVLQAYWDYMRRNFPDRLRELEEAGTELNVKIVLARSRTSDPVYLHLKENPGKVKEWLEAGKPVNTESISYSEKPVKAIIRIPTEQRGDDHTGSAPKGVNHVRR